MKWLTRLFSNKKEWKAHQQEKSQRDTSQTIKNFRNVLDVIPVVEIGDRKFAVIDSQNEALHQQMGDLLGIQIVEDSAIAHLRHGEAYSEQEKYQEAMKEFLSAAKIEPNYVDAYHAIAVNYIRMGDFDKALDSFKRTLKLAEQFIPKKTRGNAIETILVNLSVAFLNKQGLDKKDIKTLTQIFGLLKNLPPMHHCALGLLYEKLDLKNEAEAEFAKLLEIEKTGQWAALARDKIK